MKAQNDYKKQIRELQSALAIERHKNSAMAKGLIPKEYLHNYARIQIEKDRERIIQKIETTMDYPHYSLRIIDETPITLD
jgi:hypothetical protein